MSDDPTLSQGLINPTLPAGERLVALEVRVGALKEDTTTIRRTQHDMANKMQEFVAAERQCVMALQSLGEQFKAMAAQLTEHTTALGGLTARNAGQEGAWATIKNVGTILSGLVYPLAMVVAVIYFLAKNLK